MKLQSSEIVFFTIQYMKKMRKFFKDVQIVKYMLLETYFCPNSMNVENSLNIVNCQSKLKGRTTQFKSCTAKLSEPKFLLLYVNENFKNQSLVDVQLLQVLS